jgi:hypothetical protein
MRSGHPPITSFRSWPVPTEAFKSYCQELIARAPEDKANDSGIREPWYCANCRELIYNKDSDGYPAPGAPMPLVLHDGKIRNVCRSCFDTACAIAKEK